MMDPIVCSRCHALLGYSDDLDPDSFHQFYCPRCVEIKEKPKV